MEESQPAETVVHLGALPGDGDGVMWSLADSPELNVNLVRLTPGSTIGSHVNTDVDVVLVVLAGGGTVVVAGTPYTLEGSTLAYVPRFREREVRAGGQGLTYVSLHRRRGPLTLGPARSPSAPRRGPRPA